MDQRFCSTYQDIQEIEIGDIESYLSKEVCNVQGTKEFSRATEKFEKLSIRVSESQLH